MSSSNNFECETIIFGKGIGESVIVRLSEHEWMIIDSCLNEDKKPAALEYLKSRSIDYQNDVKLIIISHFHDDHIKGLHETIRSCKNAKVVISSALNTEEFKKYIDALSANGVEMAKTKEINNIMQLLRPLNTTNKLIYAKRDCILYKSEIGIEVHALSPCDRDITSSNLDFSNSLKVVGNLQEIATSAKLVNPNHYCVVTRVLSPTSSNNEILLGADLEVSDQTGWDAVCEAISSPKPNKAGLFKLPHHGSQTGYHERTWNELLKDKPISVLTTFDKSSLPRTDMIEKYKEKSSHVYCTSQPKSLEKSDAGFEKISGAVKILSKMGTSVKFSNSLCRFGYVSITKCLTPNPEVQTYLSATVL